MPTVEAISSSHITDVRLLKNGLVCIYIALFKAPKALYNSTIIHSHMHTLVEASFSQSALRLNVSLGEVSCPRTPEPRSPQGFNMLYKQYRNRAQKSKESKTHENKIIDNKRQLDKVQWVTETIYYIKR